MREAWCNCVRITKEGYKQPFRYLLEGQGDVSLTVPLTLPVHIVRRSGLLNDDISPNTKLKWEFETQLPLSFFNVSTKTTIVYWGESGAI